MYLYINIFIYINIYNCLCEQAMSNKSKSNKGFVICNVNMSWDTSIGIAFTKMT